MEKNNKIDNVGFTRKNENTLTSAHTHRTHTHARTYSVQLGIIYKTKRQRRERIDLRHENSVSGYSQNGRKSNTSKDAQNKKENSKQQHKNSNSSSANSTNRTLPDARVAETRAP